MSCSKLSNATSLSSMVISGSEEVMACMEEIIRSASEGPPNRAARASGFRFVCGGAAAGSAALALAAEFSTLHLRRVARFGSAILVVVL